MRVSTKLICLIEIMVLSSIAAISFISFQIGNRIINDRIKAQLESVIILKSHQIDNYFNERINDITSLISSKNIIDLLPLENVDNDGGADLINMKRKRLQERLNLSPVFTEFLIMDKNGEVRLATDKSHEGMLRTNSKYFIKGKKGLYTDTVNYDISKSRPVVMISAPIRDTEGKLKAVFAGEVNLALVTELMREKSGLGKTGETYLVNSYNFILTELRKEPVRDSKKFIHTQAVRDCLAKKSTDVLFESGYTDYAGDIVIGGYMYLPKREIAIIAKIDREEAYAYRKELRNSILAIAVVIGVISLGIGFAFVRTITKPIRILIESLRRIGRGNLGHRIEIHSKDEWGSLATSFNKMTEDLQKITVSRDYMDSIIKNMASTLLVVTTAGTIEAVNQATLDLLGYKENELIGKPVGMIVEEEKKDEGREEKRLSKGLGNLIEKGAVRNIEKTYLSKDGRKIPVLFSGSVMRDASGKIQKIICVAQDITERKETKEKLKEYSERLEQLVEERTKELRDAKEKLIRKEKLAVLGQLAGGVGHELRNPLGIISNCVYYLEMALSDADETIQKHLKMISSEVYKSEKIISNLLNLSRTKSISKEKIVVSELVDRILRKHTPPRGIEVNTEIASQLPPVFVDSGQIEQVLVNLVSNAYQSMSEGGKLTIKAYVKKNKVYLSLTDTGCGIPQENIKKLFEPLFTTKARGIGLGLPIAKNLVEINGGKVEVESKEGKGSTFTVILPVQEAFNNEDPYS